MWSLILSFLGRNNNALWALAVIALLIGSQWFIHHERAIGRQQAVVAAEKLKEAQIVHNQEVEARAKVLVDQAAAKLASKYAADLIDPIHLRVCKYSPARPFYLPPDAGTGSPVDGAPAPRVPVAAGTEGQGDIDIGPMTQKHLRDADAQIEALQSYIHACQQEGICSQ